MKPLLLLYVAFFLLCPGRGQYIFVSNKPLKIFNQAIDDYEASMLTDPIPFTYVRIIDTRWDTTCIGFYGDGFLKLPGASQPKALQHVIDKYYSHLYTPGRDTLIVRIDKLMVSDQFRANGSIDYTVGYLSCKEFTGSGDIYAYYGSFDTVIREIGPAASSMYRDKYENQSNHELWDHYLLRLFDAMITCHSSYQDSLYASSVHYFTAQAIKVLGLRKRDMPVLNVKRPEPGFYKSFKEFKNNTPSVVIHDDTDLLRMLAMLRYNVSGNTYSLSPDISYWGFYDGRNYYVRHNFSFYQLEQRDGGFYIAPTLDVARRNRNRLAPNILTGLAGLTTGIVTNSGIYLQGFSAIRQHDVPKIVIPQGNINLLGLVLDWDTGKITF